MGTPQAGVFDEAPDHHYYLEYRLPAGTDLADLRPVLREVIGLAPEGGHVVLAFGRDAWTRLRPEGVPSQLEDFVPIGTEACMAPATQRDIWVWILGDFAASALDAALSIQSRMVSVADLELGCAGFRRPEKRGFDGFIDGTENPQDQAKLDATLIPPEDVGAGGSYVLTQQWEHDLPHWDALPDEEQEAVIGRTKMHSVELTGDAMPPTSHVSRTDVTVDGVKQKIYRRSLPYGDVRKHGLYFLAFACQRTRFDAQLRRMFGTFGDGMHDRITEFSVPVTGAYWYAPSQEELGVALTAD